MLQGGDTQMRAPDLGLLLGQAAPQALRLGREVVQAAPQVGGLPLAVPQHLQTLLLALGRQELRARPLLQLGITPTNPVGSA